MSEQHTNEGLDTDKEECNISIEASDRTEKETNELFQFEEDTLQITDIHDFDQSTQPEFPAPVELSAKSKPWTLNESPASVEKFLEHLPNNDTLCTGAVDLQSEFAALGLNTHFPSVEHEEDSSFEISLSRSYIHQNHSDITEVTEPKSLFFHYATNTIETDIKLLKDLKNDTHSIVEPSEDTDIAFKSTDNITQNNGCDLTTNLTCESNEFDLIKNKSGISNLLNEEADGMFIATVDLPNGHQIIQGSFGKKVIRDIIIGSKKTDLQNTETMCEEEEETSSNENVISVEKADINIIDTQESETTHLQNSSYDISKECIHSTREFILDNNSITESWQIDQSDCGIVEKECQESNVSLTKNDTISNGYELQNAVCEMVQGDTMAKKNDLPKNSVDEDDFQLHQTSHEDGNDKAQTIKEFLPDFEFVDDDLNAVGDFVPEDNILISQVQLGLCVVVKNEEHGLEDNVSENDLMKETYHDHESNFGNPNEETFAPEDDNNTHYRHQSIDTKFKHSLEEPLSKNDILIDDLFVCQTNHSVVKEESFTVVERMSKNVLNNVTDQEHLSSFEVVVNDKLSIEEPTTKNGTLETYAMDKPEPENKIFSSKETYQMPNHSKTVNEDTQSMQDNLLKNHIDVEAHTEKTGQSEKSISEDFKDETYALEEFTLKNNFTENNYHTQYLSFDAVGKGNPMKAIVHEKNDETSLEMHHTIVEFNVEQNSSVVTNKDVETPYQIHSEEVSDEPHAVYKSTSNVHTLEETLLEKEIPKETHYMPIIDEGNDETALKMHNAIVESDVEQNSSVVTNEDVETPYQIHLDEVSDQPHAVNISTSNVHTLEETLLEKDFPKKTHHMPIVDERIDGTSLEMHHTIVESKVEQNSSVVNNEDVETPYQIHSEEVSDETPAVNISTSNVHTLEETLLEKGFPKKTHHMPIVDERIDGTCLEMHNAIVKSDVEQNSSVVNNEDVETPYQIHSEEVSDQPHAVYKSTSNVHTIEETLLKKEFPKESHYMTIVDEGNDETSLEMHHTIVESKVEQNSSVVNNEDVETPYQIHSEEVINETPAVNKSTSNVHTLEETLLEKEFPKGTHYMPFVDERNDETTLKMHNAIVKSDVEQNISVVTNEDVETPYQIYSDEVSDQPHAVNISTSNVHTLEETLLEKEFPKKTHHMPIVEEGNIETSLEMHHTIVESDVEQNSSVVKNEDIEIPYQIHSDEVSDETPAVNKSTLNVHALGGTLLEKEFPKETHHMLNMSFDAVGKTNVMTEFGDSRNVEASFLMHHTIIESKIEQNCIIDDSIFKMEDVEIPCKVLQIGSNEVNVETFVGNTSILKVIADELSQNNQSGTKTPSPDCVDSFNGTTLETALDPLPDVHVSRLSCSSNDEQIKDDATFGLNALNNSCQALDMSLTTVCAPSNNLNTSEISQGSEETPLNQLSQTLTDLLDNNDIKETNYFTSPCHQKAHDAMYMPLFGSNTNNYSITENCLQSFMEITMANTNEARIDQSFINMKKQAEVNFENLKYQSNESAEDFKQSKPTSCSGDSEDLITSSENYSLTFQSDSEKNDSKNHEMMQQSMSNYVTNLSLELSIPDSCDFSQIKMYDDSQKNCEIQTESVLLMEWPAQYHNNIKKLKQKNLLLFESCNQKDTLIKKITMDHEKLLQIYSKLTAQTKDLKEEMCDFEHDSSKSIRDSDVIVELKQRNEKLTKELDLLKSIETDFAKLKIDNEEFVSRSVKERLANESKIVALQSKIKELEHDLVNISCEVSDLQYKNQELSTMIVNINSKESQIKELIGNKLLLEGKLNSILKLDEEKNNEIEKLQMMLEKQKSVIGDQNEKLATLSIDLNIKESHIQELLQNKINLEETVASLNKLLKEIQSIEDENLNLKSNLKQSQDESKEMLVRNKSLEELISSHVENISKLSHEIYEKDCQIEEYTNINANLKETIASLDQRLTDLKYFEVELEELNFNLTIKDEKLKEMDNVKTSLEDQIQGLKAQNDLLWNELKVTTTKEQSLYTLKEERLQLEEKLARMKREIQDIETLKADNEHIVVELTDKIQSLSADKKQLKRSLRKANDKLNEGDAEIIKLNDEKVVIQNNLELINKQYKDLEEQLNFERAMVAESIADVSEYLSSVCIENVYLAEGMLVAETEGNKLSEELRSIKELILKDKVLFNNVRLEKESLVITICNQKEKITVLTAELNKYNDVCNELALLKDEQVTLKSKINELYQSVGSYEEEKTLILENMSSFSETVSNLLIDRQLLSEQENHCSHMTEHLALLTAEKCQLKQNNLELLQSISVLQSQLDAYKEKEMTIDDLYDLSNSLENHLSSMNEELMSEMCKNQLLSATISELERKISQNYEDLTSLQSKTSLLTDQLNASGINCNDLQELISTLEDQMSSLNEELMSEIAKNHYFSMENESLELHRDKIMEEKLALENIIFNATESLKNRLINKNQIKLSLQTCIDEVLHQIDDFVCKNAKLNQDITNCQAKLQNSKQNVSDLLEVERNLKLELSSMVGQKIELENKLTEALANESYITKLENEIESLANKAETHKSCENSKILLQDEKLKLELEVNKLTENIEALRSEQNQLETKLKDSLNLKDIMTQEIHSLTGEIWDTKTEPLIDVYQKLMKEFLSKEKEVIFSIQNDFEKKLVFLKNDLNEREVLTFTLENKVEECKVNLNERDTYISSLESELSTLHNEMRNLLCELEEIKSKAKGEKDTLIDELNSANQVKNKFEEEILVLSEKVDCKNSEILQLKNDLEKIQCETNVLLRRSEEDMEISKQQKEVLDEQTLLLNDKLNVISQLNVQLNEKTSEISQLTEFLNKKDMEIIQYVKRIEELTPLATKLTVIEKDLNVIINVTLIVEEFDLNDIICSLQNCQVFSDTAKLVVSKFVDILKELQIYCKNLKDELYNQVETSKTLETQISDMNEELKSCKILYDEDSLQFKEEIAEKNVTIAHLTEALEHLKRNTDLKTKGAEMEDMKTQIDKLKEENLKLQSETTKITYLTEVNRKLSWEIEELSRCIKFEKQNNNELKTKYDIANNQVSDLSKRNFQLEDIVEVLERKLENHDVISSLKICFPFGINTLDKQVQYLNEKLAEHDQMSAKLNMLNDDHCSLKHEYEKSKEFIKRQEEKISKIMKRELELKKQVASYSQTVVDIQTLKEVKSDLESMFPGQRLPISEVLLNLKSLVEDGKKVLVANNPEIEGLKKKIEELSHENKELDTECEMMNKHIEEQKELLASVFKREEELKQLNTELELKLSNRLQTNVDPLFDNYDLKELFEIFPDKPVSFKDSVNLVRSIMTENQSLKEKIAESQEEYASLDKECEDMFKAYKEKENDLAEVLKREASSVSDLKSKQNELEIELKSLMEELQVTRSQLMSHENRMLVPGPCQCDELKSRLSELRVDLAERNAKITALEMQFEADNFPLKKKVADLEKSLDQAKHKINDLKSEVRRYQEQMCDVTVGLRADCERCRNLGSTVDPATVTSLQQQVQEKNKEIHILKALCKTRHQRIKELEDRDGSCKVPRPQRSALKEVKENKTVPSSPTKPVKGSFQ